MNAGPNERTCEIHNIKLLDGRTVSARDKIREISRKVWPDGSEMLSDKGSPLCTKIRGVTCLFGSDGT